MGCRGLGTGLAPGVGARVWGQGEVGFVIRGQDSGERCRGVERSVGRSVGPWRGPWRRSWCGSWYWSWCGSWCGSWRAFIAREPKSRAEVVSEESELAGDAQTTSEVRQLPPSESARQCKQERTRGKAFLLTV